MITEKDLQEAIAECQGVRNPDAKTCIKLAAFYILEDHLFPKPVYSFSAGEQIEKPITLDSDTEFSRTIDGMAWEDVLPVMDELMETLQVLHPRLYDGVLRQLTK